MKRQRGHSSYDHDRHDAITTTNNNSEGASKRIWDGRAVARDRWERCSRRTEWFGSARSARVTAAAMCHRVALLSLLVYIFISN